MNALGYLRVMFAVDDVDETLIAASAAKCNSPARDLQTLGASHPDEMFQLVARARRVEPRTAPGVA